MKGAHECLATFVYNRTGKQTRIDDSIELAYLIGEISTRLVARLRGAAHLMPEVYMGRNVRLRGRRKIVVGGACTIEDACCLDARSKNGIQLGDRVKLGRGGTITGISSLQLRGEGVRIGDDSGIGEYFHLGSAGGINIGSNVIAGPGLYIHSQNHQFSDKSQPIRLQGTIQDSVTIADDCWIGSRVTILAGTYIGPRTVVASGSVVTGRFEGDVLVGGVPARVLKGI